MEEYDSETNFTSFISDLTAEDRVLASVFIVHTRSIALDSIETKSKYCIFRL